MDPEPLVMMVADISGYTRFMLEHAKALRHSQMVIAGLLDAITAEATGLLELSRLEGDAAFLFARKNRATSHDALRAQMRERIAAIFTHYSETLSDMHEQMICRCGACANVQNLKLKIVVHSGTAIVVERASPELQGVAPIVVHRLLKNNVPLDEYLLLTDEGLADVALTEDVTLQPRHETYDQLGKVRVWLTHPGAVTGARTKHRFELQPTTVPWDILRVEIKEEYACLARDPYQEWHYDIGAGGMRTCEYTEDQIARAPKICVDTYLGTGNPLSIGPLAQGERVIDVGCGAGLDLWLAAEQIGPEGQAIGVDMTDDMLQTAGRVFAEHGNVRLVQAYAEEMPIEDDWADVILSNGVLNLCPHKPKVFAELFRVLKPGGRLQIGDILVPRALRPDQRKDIDLWKG